MGDGAARRDPVRRGETHELNTAQLDEFIAKAEAFTARLRELRSQLVAAIEVEATSSGTN